MCSNKLALKLAERHIKYRKQKYRLVFKNVKKHKKTAMTAEREILAETKYTHLIECSLPHWDPELFLLVLSAFQILHL